MRASVHFGICHIERTRTTGIMKTVRLALLGAIACFAAAFAEDTKKLFHVTLPESNFKDALERFPDLDVWEMDVDSSGMVHADIYTTDSIMEHLPSAHEDVSLMSFAPASVDIQSMIEEERAVTEECQQRTRGFLSSLDDRNQQYVDNPFFDCWRTSDQFFAFLDTLTTENAGVMTKIDKVATTIDGATIPAYKLSTGTRSKAIYTQSLMHAREWQSGSTGMYVLSAFLDGLRGNDSAITTIFDEYDWYFVPIVNIDGYKYSWTNDRLWRKNRRLNPSSSPWGRRTYGVDLNRNFGPEKFFQKNGYPSSQTYPGTEVLSEPETRGIYDWLKTIPGLVGAIDIHCYSNLVLRPFGNQRGEAPEPFGTKLRNLGNAVRDAVERGSNVKYRSITAQELYLAYGTFMDSIFLEFNNMATLTFELEGDSFIVGDSTIRPVGRRITQGLQQFAAELTRYYN